MFRVTGNRRESDTSFLFSGTSLVYEYHSPRLVPGKTNHTYTSPRGPHGVAYPVNPWDILVRNGRFRRVVIAAIQRRNHVDIRSLFLSEYTGTLCSLRHSLIPSNSLQVNETAKRTQPC